MDPRLAEIAEIIDELLAIIRSSPQDLDWQSEYEDEQDLLEDLHDHAERIRREDTSRLPELKYVLFPTIALNEIAFSSGWGEPYVRLANRFDELYTGSWAVRAREVSRGEGLARREESPRRDEPSRCEQPSRRAEPCPEP